MSMTCLHSHISIYSNLTLIPSTLSHFCWLHAQFMNTRLVTMSVSLHTQTGLHCLVIQVLNTRVWFLNIRYTSPTSVHNNLEHGLAILTESFSPLRSVLHLSCWSPKQKSTSIDTQYNSSNFSNTSRYNLEHRLAIMLNKLSPLSNSTSALLEFRIWSDVTSHATLFTCHMWQLVRTSLS